MDTCIEYRVDAEAVAIGSGLSSKLPEHKGKRGNVLVYRTDLVERSETFIVAQAAAMKRYQAVFCGLSIRPEGILPKDVAQVILSPDRGVQGYVKKMAYLYGGRGHSWQAQCRACKPVLMHAHFAVDAAFALPLQKSLNIPLIVTLHGYDVTTSDEAIKLSRGGQLYLHRRSELFSRADLFVCVSEFIRGKALERGYPKEKLFVHSIGIDLDRFRPNECEHREQMVLFVGRLVEKKGCIHLIRAMEKVLQSAPETRLVVIGDGPLRQQLQKTAMSLLPGHHLFLGAQPTSVVHSWLRRAKVFSVPSVTAANGDAEGLGMVFCEAQAMGIPVVSFSSGGIAEAVLHGETGYLLPERDEKQLAEKICLLLQDRALWSEMSLRGREHIAMKFDLRMQTRILEAKFDEVIAAAS